MTVPLGIFSITDTDTGILQMKFEIRSAVPGVSIDSSVMSLKVVSGTVQPEIVLYTVNNDKIGEFEVVIRAKFDVDIPYYVDSNVFTIKILH